MLFPNCGPLPHISHTRAMLDNSRNLLRRACKQKTSELVIKDRFYRKIAKLSKTALEPGCNLKVRVKRSAVGCLSTHVVKQSAGRHDPKVARHVALAECRVIVLPWL